MRSQTNHTVGTLALHIVCPFGHRLARAHSKVHNDHITVLQSLGVAHVFHLPILLTLQNLGDVLALHCADVQTRVVLRQLLLHQSSTREILGVRGQHDDLARGVHLLLKIVEHQARSIQHLYGRTVAEQTSIELAHVALVLHINQHYIVNTGDFEHLSNLGSAGEDERSTLRKAIHTLVVLTVGEEGDNAGNTLGRGTTDGTQHKDQLEEMVVGGSAERLNLHQSYPRMNDYDVHILSADALLHLHGDLAIVEAANSTIGNTGSEALGNAVSKSLVAVSGHNLQLVASRNELVFNSAWVETGITSDNESHKSYILARTVRISAGNEEWILILPITQKE